MRRPDVPIPTEPGAYLFRDAHGRVLYVGKAKNLRARLANYFAAPARMHPRTAAMVESADSVEWVLADGEVEALMLEYSLIKEHRPRFNVRLRDDKSYPYLAITLNQEWPRPMVVRGRKRRGVRYFGPYAHAYAIRETLDLLLRTFPVRTCSDGKFRQHERLGRPCLYFHIERCCGPCVGKVDHEAYDKLTADLIAFLEGDHKPVIERLEAQMHAAADALEFEHAARLRDQLHSVRRASERQQLVGDRRIDLDVVGTAGDELETAVQVFCIRGGRITGQKGFIVDNVEEKSPPDLLRDVLLELYAGSDDVPRRIEVPVMPAEAGILSELFTQRRAALEDTRGSGRDGTRAGSLALTTGDPGMANHETGRARGGRVAIHVPQRGKVRTLLETVTANAESVFRTSRLRRQSDHNARARALNDLQDALGLADAPLRIECYDISQVQGSNPVASMVVFEDGIAKKADYRRFAIRGVEGQDDFAMMREALTRRFTSLLRERAKPVEERSRFQYPPGLLLVDGGRGQLNVALEVLDVLGLDAEIPAAGLAKRFEEVYVPGEPDPLQLPRGSEALYLLQRVRDEAHRFAVTYHRSRRDTAMTKSILDDITGLGPARRRALLVRFGSVERMRTAALGDIAGTPGVPEAVAQAVYDKLHPETVGTP